MINYDVSSILQLNE